MTHQNLSAGKLLLAAIKYENYSFCTVIKLRLICSILHAYRVKELREVITACDRRIQARLFFLNPWRIEALRIEEAVRNTDVGSLRPYLFDALHWN